MLRNRLLRNVAVRHALRLFASFGAVAASNGQSPVTIGSLSLSGEQGNFTSREPSLSGSGRIVAFTSFASNFYALDDNGGADIYVRNLDTGVLTCASVDATGHVGYFGAEASSLSADGRYVAFNSANVLVPGASGYVEVFVRDLSLGTTVRACLGVGGAPMNANSSNPKISANGQFVVFGSGSSTLVANDVNGTYDVFVFDQATSSVSLVSVNSAGQPGNSESAPGLDISNDGQFVAFASYSTNLVNGDTNGLYDVFVRDLVGGMTTRVSLNSAGLEGNGHSGASGAVGDSVSISADGRFVAFRSEASNLVSGDTNSLNDIFVRDRTTGQTTRVNVSSAGEQTVGPSSTSNELDISGDGRYVVFESNATNLAFGTPSASQNIFIHDRFTAQTRRLSVSQIGGSSSGTLSNCPAISSDGRIAAFSSTASDLVPNDVNGWFDVFLVDHQVSQPVVYCTAKTNSQGCLPTISFSGTPSVANAAPFTLDAANVLPARPGSLVYSISGPGAVSCSGGWLCSAPPRIRTPIQIATGAGPCAGFYTFDFNMLIASGQNAALVAGQGAWCQYWTRDPANHFKTGLTDAVHFLIQP